jgi:hypothetical protein
MRQRGLVVLAISKQPHAYCALFSPFPFRCREHVLDAAVLQFKNMLVWRTKFAIEGIMDETFPKFTDNMGQVLGLDEEKRPVVVNFYGR